MTHINILPDEQLAHVLRCFCTELEYGVLRIVNKKLHRLVHLVMLSFTEKEKEEHYIGFLGNKPNDPIVPILAIMNDYTNLIEWAFENGLFQNWSTIVYQNNSFIGLYMMYGGNYSIKDYHKPQISWNSIYWLRDHSFLSDEMEMGLID